MIGKSNRDPSAMQSKKFIAYMSADVAWTLLLIVAILNQDDKGLLNSSLLLSMVIVKGFIQAGYLGAQAWLDRYVRVAEIVAGKGDDAGKGGDAPTS